MDAWCARCYNSADLSQAFISSERLLESVCLSHLAVFSSGCQTPRKKMMEPDPEAPPPPSEEVMEVTHPRSNGCQCPWNPLQFVAWFFVVFFAVAHFGFLVFYVPGYWRIPLYIVPGLILLIYVLCTIVTTALNPAEPLIRNKGRRSRRKFNPAKDGHVIENRYCRLCEVYVSESTKHCRVCDKCVADFDHHCRWLNTCIGGRNYRWFFTTILTALLGALLLCVYSSSLFVVYLVDMDLLRYNCPHSHNLSLCDPEFKIFSAVMPHQVFPTLCVVIAVLSAVAVLLDGHLTAFHIYLKCKGISTYDYILIQREKEEAAKNTPPQPPLCRRLMNRLRKNQVVPSASQLSDNPHSVEEGRPSPTTSSDCQASPVSNRSVGMANFGRTPQSSMSTIHSLTHEVAATLSQSHSDLPIDPTVIELDPLTQTPNKKLKVDKVTTDSSLPEHLHLSPPVTPSQTLIKAASTGDLHTSSTLSFLVGDHSNFECVAKPPIMPNHVHSPVTSLKDTSKRTSSPTITLEHSLSGPRPLPPIGSYPMIAGKVSSSQSKSPPLKAPKTLPALRARASSLVNGMTTSEQIISQQDCASAVSSGSSGCDSNAGTFV